MDQMNSYFVAALIIAAAVAGIVLLVRLITSPLKKIVKLLLHTALGMGILLVLNIFGRYFGFSFEIEPIRCLIAAIFGVPGVIIMVIITILI